MKSNTPVQNNKLYWVYLIGFFLILALPLLNLPPWFSPPDWGKTIIFRIVLSILIFLFIYQLLFQRNQLKRSFTMGILRQRKSKAFLPFLLLIALLGVYFLATLFSLDTYFSLWASPHRSGGFVNFAFYIILIVLMLSILDKKGWQRVWDFAIFIGVLVSLVAICQIFNLLGGRFFIHVEAQAPSTIGGHSFLGTYLLLLGFLSLSFGIKEQRIIKRIFYLSSFVLFFAIVLLVQARAAFVGIVIGLLFFIFFYPRTKKSALLKIISGILLILGIAGFYFLKTNPETSLFEKESRAQGIIERVLSIPFFDIEEIKEMSRFSSWRVSLKALKDRPILGFGPENFNIAFDKHYDPSLPKIEKHAGLHASWWDRAHNFIFDISLTAGIPALIIYLLIFSVLFWQLQRLKKKRPEQSLIYHAIQATFIGFLIANFFTFDVFSTYLISFLLIGYSLFLIYKSNIIEDITPENRQKQTESLWKSTFIFVLFCVLIWFIWAYNIKPFQINTQINIAKYLVNNKKCEQALDKMDNILPKKSFLDGFVRLKYTDYMRQCESQQPDKTLEYAQKGAELLKENIEIQPFYTRNWILLGGFMSVLIEKEMDPEVRQELIKETSYYFEKAYELSPKRQEVFIEWIKYELVSENYQKAKEKSQTCIDLNPNLADCYWYVGLSEVFLGNLEQGKRNLEIANEKGGYPVNSLISLNQLAKAHSIAKNYQELVEVYQKLIKINPKEPQYHATLAFIYKELEEYQKARQEAMKVIELQPEAKELVEEFLRTLPY